MLEVSAGHERLLAGNKDHALDAFILSQNRRRFFHIGNKGVRYHVHGFVGIVEDQGGEAVIRLFDFKVTHGIMSRFAKGGAQTRSIIAAVPSPLAAHSVIRPVLRSRRSSSSSPVPRIIAPVAPTDRKTIM